MLNSSDRDLEVEVAIIGAGSAGLSALSEVLKVTDRVILADDGPLGTTCARVGCMPSKGLIEWPNLPAGEREGTNPFARTRALRDDFVSSVVASMKDNQRFLLRERARFVEPGVLRVGKRVVRAKHVIVATGSSPIVPDEWRALGDRVLTSDTIFELNEVPKSCAVLGAGPLGLELGQALARLGSKVDLFAVDRKVGGLSDPAVQDAAISRIGRELNFHFGPPAKPGPGGEVTSGDVRVKADKILLSIGRKPNIADLDLEKAGVELDEKGRPKFDETTRRAGTTSVFFAGDAAGDRPILHEAVFQGRIAGFNATKTGPSHFSEYPKLNIAFTHPNLAVVGVNFASLKNHCVGEVNFARQGRARLKGEPGGLLRVYADPKTGRLLGSEMACPGAEHLSHLLAFALTKEATIADLLKTPYYHPTLEEGLRSALVDVLKKIERHESASDQARCESAAIGTG